MKRTVILVLILSLIIFVCVACSSDDTTIDETYGETTECDDPTPLKGRNVVYTNNVTTDTHDIELVTDGATKESVYRAAMHILQVVIVELEEYKFNGMGGQFEYAVYIEKIYYDEGCGLEEGDVITIRSNNGILPATALCGEQVTGFNHDASEYDENDIATFSYLDGIPTEVGGRYIIYLQSDVQPHGETTYTERSFSFSYGIFDGIYRGADMVKTRLTLEEIEADIANSLAIYKSSDFVPKENVSSD